MHRCQFFFMVLLAMVPITSSASNYNVKVGTTYDDALSCQQFAQQDCPAGTLATHFIAGPPPLTCITFSPNCDCLPGDDCDLSTDPWSGPYCIGDDCGQSDDFEEPEPDPADNLGEPLPFGASGTSEGAYSYVPLHNNLQAMFDEQVKANKQREREANNLAARVENSTDRVIRSVNSADNSARVAAQYAAASRSETIAARDDILQAISDTADYSEEFEGITGRLDWGKKPLGQNTYIDGNTTPVFQIPYSYTECLVQQRGLGSPDTVLSVPCIELVDYSHLPTEQALQAYVNADEFSSVRGLLNNNYSNARFQRNGMTTKIDNAYNKASQAQFWAFNNNSKLTTLDNNTKYLDDDIWDAADYYYNELSGEVAQTNTDLTTAVSTSETAVTNHIDQALAGFTPGDGGDTGGGIDPLDFAELSDFVQQPGGDVSGVFGGTDTTAGAGGHVDGLGTELGLDEHTRESLDKGEVDLQQFANDFDDSFIPAASSCPASRSINFTIMGRGQSFELNYQPMCDILELVGFIIMFSAYVSSAFIIAGVRKVGS